MSVDLGQKQYFHKFGRVLFIYASLSLRWLENVLSNIFTVHPNAQSHYVETAVVRKNELWSTSFKQFNIF